MAATFQIRRSIMSASPTAAAVAAAATAALSSSSVSEEDDAADEVPPSARVSLPSAFGPEWLLDEGLRLLPPFSRLPTTLASLAKVPLRRLRA